MLLTTQLKGPRRVALGCHGHSLLAARRKHSRRGSAGNGLPRRAVSMSCRAADASADCSLTAESETNDGQVALEKWHSTQQASAARKRHVTMSCCSGMLADQHSTESLDIIGWLRCSMHPLAMEESFILCEERKECSQAKPDQAKCLTDRMPGSS